MSLPHCPHCHVPATEEHLQSKDHAYAKHVAGRVFRGYRVKEDHHMCLPCGVANLTKDVFDRHILGGHENGHYRDVRKYNKMKAWYCQRCDAQSRSEAEWDNHITTAKHLKGKVDYHCAACEYSTKLAHLVKQHERTNKHINNIQKM